MCFTTSITRDNFPINAPIVYTGFIAVTELDKKFTRSWLDHFDLRGRVKYFSNSNYTFVSFNLIAKAFNNNIYLRSILF